MGPFLIHLGRGLERTILSMLSGLIIMVQWWSGVCTQSATFTILLIRYLLVSHWKQSKDERTAANKNYFEVLQVQKPNTPNQSIVRKPFVIIRNVQWRPCKSSEEILSSTLVC